MIALSCLMLTACDKDDNNPNNPDAGGEQSELYFSIKAATIVYSTTNVPDFTGDVKISFDDYGKKFRIEMEKSIRIIDENANIYYILMPESKTYMESANNTPFQFYFMYLPTWQNFPNFKKDANQTIAGKNCEIYSWTDNTADIIWGNVIWGGWKGVTLMSSSTTTNGTPEKIEAKTFTESANASDFVVPADYTKITYED